MVPLAPAANDAVVTPKRSPGHVLGQMIFYMDKIIPISDLQTKAKQYVEQVKETEQPVVITQRGRASAVLVSYEVYEGFLATRDEMS